MRNKMDFELIGEILSSGRSYTEALSEQIATVVKYLIATNAIAQGQSLPALRKGAAALRVNMHTLRHAYRILDEDGYVETVRSVGYRVRRFEKRRTMQQTAPGLNAFLDDVATEALLRFGLTEADLAELLIARAKDRPAPGASFIECSISQAAMHARQVETSIGASCSPIVINNGPPPRGFCVTTYFHLDDIERAWPGAKDAMHLVHIRIASGMADAIREAMRAGGKIIIGEFDAVLGARIAKELSLITGENEHMFDVRKLSRDENISSRDNGEIVFLAPRVWSRTPDNVRTKHNMRQIEYEIEPDDARALAASYAQYEKARLYTGAVADIS